MSDYETEGQPAEEQTPPPEKKKRRRRRRRKKDTQASQPKEAGNHREKKMAAQMRNVWVKYLAGGQRAKRVYTKAAEDTLAGLKEDHAAYQEGAVGRFLGHYGEEADEPQDHVYVSVNKAAQTLSALGPHLYQQNPKANVVSQSRDAVSMALATLLEAYINWSSRESKQARQIRKAIMDGLMRGRGFLRTGYREQKRLVTSWYVSSKDVLIDPDVDCIEDAYWIAIRRREPIWVVKDKYRVGWRTAGLKPNAAPTDDEGEEGFADALDPDEDKLTTTNDMVEYYEVYSKMGNGLRYGTEAPNKDGKKKEHNRFVKLVICTTHEVPLEVGDWEVPVYLDEEWPIVHLDLAESIDELWPTSVMSLAMGHNKAINLYATIALYTARAHGAERYLVSDAIKKDQIEKIRTAGMTGVIPVTVPPSGRIQDTIHRFDTGTAPAELRTERDWHAHEMGMTTGALPLLVGGMEQSAQDRSATATQARSRAATSRLNDMVSKVEEFKSASDRIAAIMIRMGGVLADSDIEKVIRAKGITFGYRVSVTVGGVEMDLRYEMPEDEDETPEEKKERIKEEALTIEGIFPPAATYFESGEQAEQAKLAVGMAIVEKSKTDRRYQQLLQWITKGGTVPPEESEDLVIREVTVTDVLNDTAGVDAAWIAREFEYELAVGSTRKPTPEAKQDRANNMQQHVLPVAVNVGDYNLVNEVFKRVDDAFEVPQEERLPPMQPPAPPSPPAGQPA